MPYEFSPEAEADLLEIAAFIAAHNPVAARKLVSAIFHACGELAAQPSLGHPRKDLTPHPEVRFYGVRRHYLIIYRLPSKPLQIVRILHGARDVEDELTEPI